MSSASSASLPSESAVHSSRNSAKKGKIKTSFERLVGRRKKTFNRRTYKNHSLGDCIKMIRTYGTTDSYSTEGVGSSNFLIRGPILTDLNTQPELEHRNPKSLYTRTSRKHFEKQLTKMERMQARIRQKINNKARKSALQPDKGPVPESSLAKYHIRKTQNNPVDLGPFLQEYRDDPAVKVAVLYFINCLLYY